VRCFVFLRDKSEALPFSDFELIITMKDNKTNNNRSAAGRSRLAVWIEAMRLRTLPASISGVMAGVAVALQKQQVEFNWIPALICLLFALAAQIGSNFANEYYDYKDGLDRPGRDGFRRGVTEGDITPLAMQRAMATAFGIAALLGLSLIYWGGWWLLLAGLFIFIGALSYSAGPFPLSRNAMGELAVIVFYGFIPVSFTFYLQAGYFTADDSIAGLAIGLLSANILIVNNYRDYDDDKAVNKLTTAVVFGRKAVAWAYLLLGIIAVGVTVGLWQNAGGNYALILPGLYLVGHFGLWRYITTHNGKDLNRALGLTAMLMLFFSLGLLVLSAIH
jgi:1,4-dihydroxy-2-naphthoate octaprenyltransferase